MKKGITILFVLMMALSGRDLMAQNQSDFPAFSDTFQELENRIEIYPNPAVEYINIEIKDYQLREISFVLHNIIGNKIEIIPEKTSDNKYRIGVEDFPPGYYLLSVKDPVSDFNKTYKFLKK